MDAKSTQTSSPVGSNFQLLFETIARQPARKSELRAMIDYQQIVEPQFRLDLLLLGTNLVARLRKRDLWRSHVFRLELVAVDDRDRSTELCSMTGDEDLETHVPMSTSALRVRLTDTLNRNKIVVWKRYPLVVPCEEVCSAIPYHIQGVPVPAPPPPPPAPPPPPSAFERKCSELEAAIMRDFAARVRGAKLREKLRQHPEFGLLDTFQQGQQLDSVERAFDPDEED